MIRPARRILIATALLLTIANGAVAATCREQAARLARDYDLQWPKPPVTVESRGPTATDEFAPPEKPAETPEGDTAMTSEAPKEAAPEVAPPPTKKQVEDLTAEQRTRMEALLLEAVKADDQGESERCFERLNEAKAVP